MIQFDYYDELKYNAFIFHRSGCEPLFMLRGQGFNKVVYENYNLNIIFID
ncbi:hypothetical protein ACJIZ3_019966 [Penstemon smallii]|uniref:Uncharacterized protein n=1 Tax=Penstemon smallii TaxID=265156 RepID=A0ABD3T2N0_9LAMI